MADAPKRRGKGNRREGMLTRECEKPCAREGVMENTRALNYPSTYWKSFRHACSNWSWLRQQISSLTLFVTHYPSLAELEAVFPNQVTNNHMAFMASQEEGYQENTKCYTMEEEAGGSGGCVPSVTFLYHLVNGAAARSYGLNVARLAGIPKETLHLAAQKSNELENAIASRRYVTMAIIFFISSGNCQWVSSIPCWWVLTRLKRCPWLPLFPCDAVVRMRRRWPHQGVVSTFLYAKLCTIPVFPVLFRRRGGGRPLETLEMSLPLKIKRLTLPLSSSPSFLRYVINVAFVTHVTSLYSDRFLKSALQEILSSSHVRRDSIIHLRTSLSKYFSWDDTKVRES